MTNESFFADYTARLREFIREQSLGAGGTAPSQLRTPPGSATESSPRHDKPDAEFNSLARTLFNLQFNHNEPYRRFCLARAVTPETVRDWSQIPAVPTAAFKEIDLTSLPPAERTVVFHSSGTTRQRPSRHFHNTESLAIYEASLWPWFNAQVLGGRGQAERGEERQPAGATQPAPKSLAAGIRPTSPAARVAWTAIRTDRGLTIAGTDPFGLCSLTPPPALAPRSSLVHMFDVVRRKLAAPESTFVGRTDAGGAWTLEADTAVRALQHAEADHAPSLILGTAFSFVHLLDHLGELNRSFHLAPGSRAMETGGYKGHSRAMSRAELHALITERLGIPPANIICEYGMSELSSQAYDTVAAPPNGREPERVFRFPPWARVRILSPETGAGVDDGETGLIRVCDLANVRSVMAIQTEDLGIRRGAGFELIGRAAQAEPRGCSVLAS